MISIQMVQSPDVTRYIDLLKQFPNLVRKYYQPALKRSTKSLETVIKPTIPVLSGRARDEFGSKVSGTTITSMKGQVGWYDKNDPWYMNIVESGAKAHPLTSGSTARTRKGRNQFERDSASGSLGGQPVFVQSAGGWRTMKSHPGFSKRGFMAAGYSAVKPIVDQELFNANEGIVRELALR